MAADHPDGLPPLRGARRRDGRPPWEADRERAAAQGPHGDDADAELRGQRQDAPPALALQRVVGHLHHVDAPRAHDLLGLAERRGAVVGGADAPMRPASRSRSSQGRCSAQATRSWTCSRSTRPPSNPSCASGCRRAARGEVVQIVVATIASPRRGPSARPSTASARTSERSRTGGCRRPGPRRPRRPRPAGPVPRRGCATCPGPPPARATPSAPAPGAPWRPPWHTGARRSAP